MIKSALLKRRVRPASFITNQGNKYRLKTQTSAQEDDFSLMHHCVVVGGRGGGEISSSGGLGSSNAVNMGANASGSERGAVEDNKKTYNGAEVVLTEGAEKSVVVGAEVPADPLPKASVRLPAKVYSKRFSCLSACSSGIYIWSLSAVMQVYQRKRNPRTIAHLHLKSNLCPRSCCRSAAIPNRGSRSKRAFRASVVIKSIRGRGVEPEQDGTGAEERRVLASRGNALNFWAASTAFLV